MAARSIHPASDRIRMDFLNQYQEMILIEPESGVNQALEEAFLALRKASEAVD